MKTLKIIIASATLLFFSIFAFYGCKKTANNESKEQDNLAEIYRQKLRNEPSTSTITVNLPGKGYYGDINGNRIAVTQGIASRPDGSSCPDPGNSEFEQELVSITKEFTCNVGYRFVVQYKITSEFYPLLTNSSGQQSKGRIRLLNSSGVQVYITPTSSINPILSIQNNGVVGQNSNGDDMNEFLVTYRSEIISEATYNLAASVQSNLTCYTDCLNYATLIIGFSPQQQVEGYTQNTMPCLRVDKVFWSPRNGSTPPSLAGCNPVGSLCFPYGYVYPAKQEVQYKNNQNQWIPFHLTHFINQTGTQMSLIDYWDVWYIDVTSCQTAGLTTGNVQVRYRNNHNVNANGGPCVTQPNGYWVTETWYIN